MIWTTQKDLSIQFREKQVWNFRFLILFQVNKVSVQA